MLSNLEALAALAEAGTMTQAATRLRITQSAISKRIASLQDELGFEVIERDGRRVRLTAAGCGLLARANPLLAELRHAISGHRSDRAAMLSIGVSESVLSSWGAIALADACTAIPGLELTLSAHRSPVAVDRVRSGDYGLALCAGDPDTTGELSTVEITREEMVIVPSRLRRLRLCAGHPLHVLTIEPGSATWHSLGHGLSGLRKTRDIDVVATQTVQSFSCVIQMARAGFGHALAPRSLALAMGIEPEHLVGLPRPGLSRPVRIVGRRAALARPLVSALINALQCSVRKSPLLR